FGKIKKVISNKWMKNNPDTPVDIQYHGIKLRLLPQKNTIESKILFSSRFREKKELLAIKEKIKNGGTFIDIGANLGYYSLMTAKAGAGKIIAVEPNPSLFNRLQQLSSLNGFDDVIEVFQTGLGAQKGQITLTISDEDLGSSSACNPDVNGKQIKIEVQILQDLLSQNGITKLDAMKIDVEGMEDKILFPFFENAPSSLHPSLIIIEENDNLWERNILQWLLENGYKTASQTKGNYILEKST
ncbi:MAG: FkbM family methyltransferase, partial [Pseudomonadota bacterium]